MTRLPFPVPTDPVVEARSELYEDGFGEYMVPEAVMRFRQGFGRLIRSGTDRGAFVNSGTGASSPAAMGPSFRGRCRGAQCAGHPCRDLGRSSPRGMRTEPHDPGCRSNDASTAIVRLTVPRLKSPGNQSRLPRLWTEVRRSVGGK